MNGGVAVRSTTGRVCAWCAGPIPVRARKDAVTCSKSCRQARHRFTQAVGQASTTPVACGQPRRLAYADPPYPGKSRRYYGEHEDFAGEVDHAALIEWLSAEHDAWALSTSAEALQAVLALCPPGSRVAAWHRGFRPNRQAHGPLNAWEPVIYGGRVLRRPDPRDASRSPAPETRPAAARRDTSSWFDFVAPFLGTDPSPTTTATDPSPAAADASRSPGEPVAQDLHDTSAISTRRVDSLIYQAHPRTTDPSRVIGAKPATFCRWVFDLLGATDADDLVDVFPGSGGVSRAWQVFAGKPAIRGDRSW